MSDAEYARVPHGLTQSGVRCVHATECVETVMPPLLLPIVVVVALFGFLASSLRVVREYRRAVVFRLGRSRGACGPGVIVLLPFLDRAVMVDVRVITAQLDPQETITRDGVAVRVSAVLWYHAADPERVVVSVADWREAVIQAAETAMRDAIGQNDLDSLLKNRPAANAALSAALATTIEGWGVELRRVELRDLDIPENMQRAIAREAEAIREKRARIIKAEGEFEAAEKLSQAARFIAAFPAALELRRLQTLAEIGAEHNSTIVVAMPTAPDPLAVAALTHGVSTAPAPSSV
jgi:regulator of protease activity HflC (stomatin/prohibitin superfamily)